jgi:hypothetical protein
MQLITRAFRLFAPWVRRMVVSTATLTIMSIITFWGRVPGTSRAIADEWLDRAIANGFPSKYDRHLYYIFYILAFGMAVITWIVMSIVTVLLLLLIF